MQGRWWRRAREMAGKINEGCIWAREAAREIRLVGRWGCGWEQVRVNAQRHGQIDMETHSCRARHVGLPEAYQSYLGIRAVFRDKSDGTDMLVPRVLSATCSSGCIHSHSTTPFHGRSPPMCYRL